MVDAALGGEELQSIIDAHGEDLADILALEENAQGVRIESPPAADIAEHLHVGQETHFDALHTLALAGIATPADGVEGEAAGSETADSRLGGVGIQPADRIPESDIGGRTGARRLADGCLIDLENPADRLPSADAIAAQQWRIGSAPFAVGGPRQQALQVAQ